MTFGRALSRLLREWSGGGHQQKMSPRNVIFISGCDSGLGFSLALYCHNLLNMTVFAACHNIESPGAKLLQQQKDSKRMITIELDLIKSDTIVSARKRIDELLSTNVEYALTALVNNAGVMCFGEFEWQTHEQMEMQMNVNVLGTMTLTKALLPQLRQHRARIINITSHCSLQALPGLSLYVASKAALRFWNDGLRIEMQQYGVNVINFIPGSFVLSSNIAARQPEHAQLMFNEFNDEQRNFYGAYFKRFHDYLQLLAGFKPPNEMQDEELLVKFKHALTSVEPKTLYKHETWRYKFYHILFRWCPTPIVDWLTVSFCAMPTYEQVTEEMHSSIPAAHAHSNGHVKSN